MGKGGDKPKKPKMSQAEKVDAAVANAQWNHYKENYAPLERSFLADSVRDHSARAKANADNATFRAGTSGLAQLGASGTSGRTGSTVGNALAASREAAIAAERSDRDKRTLSALGVGRELATDSASSLGTLGRMGAQTSINEMHNKLKVDQAKTAARQKMIGSVVGAAAGAYAGMNDTGPATNMYDELGTTAAKRKTVPNQYDGIF